MEFVTTSDNDIVFYAIWTIYGLQCDLNTLLKGLGFGITVMSLALSLRVKSLTLALDSVSLTPTLHY